MRILVTNDDGVDSPGIAALAGALDAVGEVTVVGPATNQTAKARSITLEGVVDVDEGPMPDGRRAYAVWGTPVDCVRFALLGLLDERPDVVVAGINLGANLGDDVAYSGTVAAAFEGLLFGLPSIAVSQRSSAGELAWTDPRRWDFEALCRFVPRLVERVCERGLPEGTLLNVNGPAVPLDELAGVRVTRLGRRVYRTSLDLVAEEGGRRRYRLLDDDPSHHEEPGSDLTAIADGAISVTPLHYDATAHAALDALRGFGLEELAPA